MLMGPGLDNTGKVFYTINNKRKQAEDRNNIKRDTYPALFYYYKKQQKRVRIN
jgi:pyridoxine/pyridoxamine 5'-phosphate oxidase